MNLYTDNTMFNAEYYLANNPDLVEAGVTLETAGAHYYEYGAAETLNPESGRVGPNAWFNIVAYKDLNADLDALLEDEDSGFTAGDLLAHFSNYGAAEARTPNLEFSATEFIDAQLFLDYALANPDLQEAFGIAADATRLTDEQQANVAYQFFAYGINEEREGGIADVIEIPVEFTEVLEQYAAAKKDAAEKAAEAVAAEEAVTVAEDAVEDAQSELDSATTQLNGPNAPAAVAGLLGTEFEQQSPAEQAKLVANAQTNLKTVEVQKESAAYATANAAKASNGAKILNDAAAELKAVVDAAAEANEDFGLDADGTVPTPIDEGALDKFVKANAALDTAVVVDNFVFDVENDNFNLTADVDGDAILLFSLGDNDKLGLTKEGAKVAGSQELLAAAAELLEATEAVQAVEDAMPAKIVAALGAAGMLQTEVDVALTASEVKQVVISDGTDGFNAGELHIGNKAVLVAEIDAAGTVTLEDTTISATDVSGLFTNPGFTDGEDFAAFMGKVYATGTNDTLTLSGNTLYTALRIAQKDVADFDALVDDWNAAKEGVDAADAALEQANEDVTTTSEAAAEAAAAQAAAKAAVEKAAAADGEEVNLVEADEDGNYVATEGIDLFVFADGEDLSIQDFGTEDKIFINDADYTVTVVPTGKTIADVSDAEVLQIFVEQDAAGTTLTVEKEVYSSSVAGSEDLTTIELAGVTGDVSFEDGFLTIG